MNQDMKIIIGIVAASVVILAAGVFFAYKSDKSQTNAKPVDASILVRDDSYKTATGSASVTIVEFADYQCPACKSAQPVVKQILSEYKDRINFVFRNFPLPMHANAEIAALAAEAAGEQGKYWEMHDLLYENQKEWSESNKPMDFLLTYAKKIGLDEAKFKKSVEDKKFGDKIQRDLTDGTTAGVDATPTFFINGRKFTGILPYQDFKKEIDSELSKSTTK